MTYNVSHGGNDMKESAHNNSLRDLSRVALAAAVLCILGPLSLPIPLSPVPISLTQLGIYLAAYVLGKKKGTMAVAVYLLIGLTGLPVFSGFSGGAGKLLGPTGGYLLGFIPMCFLAGLSLEHYSKSPARLFAGFVLANAACYALGSLWLSHEMALSLKEAFFLGCVPYIPADLTKTAFAMYFGPKLTDALQNRHLI